MGRLSQIEDLVAGTLNDYMNLKMLVRGRPRYLDPRMDRGYLRFGNRRGANFTALLPDNKPLLSSSAFKNSTQLFLQSRPNWFQIEHLIRVGASEDVGELHLIDDLVGLLEIRTVEPLGQDYIVTADPDVPYHVTLLGTPGYFYALSMAPFERRVLLIESWYKMVPGDVLLLSPTPEVLDSLVEFEVKRADFIDTRPGVGNEPALVYRYEVEINSTSGLIPFTPTLNLRLYLKAQPLFARGDFADGDLRIPQNIGPCLVDAFHGGLLINQQVTAKFGLKTWDVAGNQLNLAQAGNQEWQLVPFNHLILERSIRSDTFLFWQRISGHFQYNRGGFFQAELDDRGEFVMSSDILVPSWSSDRQHGWVIPISPRSPVRVAVRFEPQDRQVYDLPSNTLSFIRPKLFVDPEGRPVTRIVFAIKGAPNSRVEIRDWTYDGSTVNSLSYFLLGTQAAFGDNRWLAGGFNVKPLFFNLDVLKGRYSDGNTRYNAGYIYA